MAILTEKQKIKLVDVCTNDTSVYLQWVNDLGGFDTWLFNGNTHDLPQVSNQRYFDKNLDDLLDEKANFEVLSKDYDEAIRVHGDFPKENAEGFKQLLPSKDIKMYDKDTATWSKVDVVAESFMVQKYKPYGKIILRIILNRKYL